MTITKGTAICSRLELFGTQNKQNVQGTLILTGYLAGGVCACSCSGAADYVKDYRGPG